MAPFPHQPWRDHTRVAAASHAHGKLAAFRYISGVAIGQANSTGAVESGIHQAKSTWGTSHWQT